MKNKFIVVDKVPKEGIPYKTAINFNNVVEVTPKDNHECWLKYWDGKEIRNTRIANTLEEVVAQVG